MVVPSFKTTLSMATNSLPDSKFVKDDPNSNDNFSLPFKVAPTVLTGIVMVCLFVVTELTRLTSGT